VYNRCWHGGVWFWLSVLEAAACSSSPPPAAHGGGDVAGQRASDGSGGSGGSGIDNANPSQSLVPTIMAMPGGDVSDACTGELQTAQEVQVDMYIMLDRSASMQEKTGAGPSKWDAVGAAIRGFVQDPQSKGLAVGIQYFPLGVPGVPETCTTDRECGSGGACVSKACLPAAGDTTITPCLSDDDCSLFSGGCVPFGTCFNIGKGGCQDQGDCTPYQGSCTNYASCTAGDYAKPAVALGTLPDNAMALLASLNGTKPLGNTPTPPALTGALDFTAAQAKQHPDHRVIAVLATDGLPTECLGSSPVTEAQAIAATSAIAAKGLSGTPSIPTYVIGVFSSDDKTSPMNLQQLAAAGGTKQAFIVDQSQDVTAQLLSALAQIRSGSLACEYSLPASPQGQTLDYNTVNVQLTLSDKSTKNILYVTDNDHCSKAALGWFYDADPAKGGTPTKINVCPDTCTNLRAQTGATLQIKLGCATMGPE
jgi:hypothetical protein